MRDEVFSALIPNSIFFYYLKSELKTITNGDYVCIFLIALIAIVMMFRFY